MKLWPENQHDTEIIFYEADTKKSDAAIVIFPGGGYSMRAEHEGKGYAEFFNANGINAFVVEYRVSPNRFPLPLLDARRSVRFVRANAEKFGIDSNKIAVMGSSAGGHLAALLSTYKGKIDFEGVDDIDEINYLPDAQILCYPVIANPETGFSHVGSYINLLGENADDMYEKVDPVINADRATPPAFIWHTAADDGVNVKNSYFYAAKLRDSNVPVEMHIFPDGRHGLGLAPTEPHVAQWAGLLINWIEYIGWMK